MQTHSESINTSTINNKGNQTSPSTIPIAHTWLHGDETEQVLSKLPEMEQKIVHSFLNQLADKEKIKTPLSCHKFFDPMAGP